LFFEIYCMYEEKLKKAYPLVVGSTTSILRTPTKPIDKITGDMRKFCKDLIELMWIYEGVGLAAPQVDKSLRIAAFTQWDYSKKDRKLLMENIMINPEIIAQSDTLIIDKEGCLSLPDITGEVARPKWVTVRFQDMKGKPQVLKAVGYNARIVLHEIDHLDGILFIDKLVSSVE